MSSEITKFPKVIILFFLITFGTFLGLLFTPALPAIAADFNVPESTADLTMSIFLVGYTIGQLPYGPISNRFGRKKAITIGAVIALSGTLLAYFSTEFWVLCLARLIQAIGAGSGLKVGFNIIGDEHSGGSALKALATISIAFGIMPGLAAAIGGYIAVFAGWRGCFLFLSAYIVLLWIFCQFIPETAKKLDKDALDIEKIGRGLFYQFRDSYITLHAFLAGLSTSVLYVFATISPYIAIERIGLTPDQFGLWTLIPSLGLISASLISRNLAMKSDPRILILSGILMNLLSGGVLSICFANSFVNVWTLFLPAYFINIGGGLVWSASLARGLSGAADKSNASATMQFINIGTTTAAVFLTALAPPTTTMLFPAALGVIYFLMFIVWLKLYRYKASNS